MDKIAILIPCKDEATAIKNVVNSFRQVLPEAVVYVYDNNSVDDTARLAAEAGAIVRHERQQGKGNVVRRMFREVDAECYLIVDGDGTYPAEAAPKLVDAVTRRGVDMAVGDRLSTTYFGENKRPMHGFGNRIVRNLVRHIYHSDIRDIMTGYRAFSRRFVKLFPVMSPHFEIETEMTLHALDKRFVVEEIPIEYRDREAGGSASKLRTLHDGRKVLNTILLLFREYKPMRFFGLLAALLALLAVAFFLPVFVEYLHTGLVPRFPTLFLSLFIGMAALMSLFTGLILDVIVQKDRKMYELMIIEFETSAQ